MNSNGSGSDPCGMPLVTGLQFEKQPSTNILLSLVIHSNILSTTDVWFTCLWFQGLYMLTMMSKIGGSLKEMCEITFFLERVASREGLW